MTYSRAELFAQDQLTIALAHEASDKLTIHGDAHGWWRDQWFITPARAVTAALALEARGLVTVQRLPGLAIVRKVPGR